MPARRYLPEEGEFRELVARGMTNAEIARLVFERTGRKLTSSAISQARERYGLEKTGQRYDDLLPWRVAEEHAMHRVARLLRWEARRRRGIPLGKREEVSLRNWLRKLEEANAVVHYDRDTDEGFFYIPRRPEDDDIIRRPKDDARASAR